LPIGSVSTVGLWLTSTSNEDILSPSQSFATWQIIKRRCRDTARHPPGDTRGHPKLICGGVRRNHGAREVAYSKLSLCIVKTIRFRVFATTKSGIWYLLGPILARTTVRAASVVRCWLHPRLDVDSCFVVAIPLHFCHTKSCRALPHSLQLTRTQHLDLSDVEIWFASRNRKCCLPSIAKSGLEFEICADACCTIFLIVLATVDFLKRSD
jgi:hypothetical protein